MNTKEKHVFPYVSENFKLQASSDLEFPYSDMGFLYGYGLFESILVSNGKARLIAQHFNRLKRSSIMLDIDVPWAIEEFMSGISDLIKKNGVEEAILNVYLSAGDRSGLLIREQTPKPILLMVLRPYEKDKLKKNVVLDIQKESFQRTPLDGLKTMAWMKNWLELRFRDQDTDDVLLYNQENEILETALANVFFTKGYQLITPKSNCILDGITRQVLLDNLEKLPYDIVWRTVHKDELVIFDEIFICNALRGIIKVDKLMGYPNLKSKETTENIQRNYEELFSHD